MASRFNRKAAAALVRAVEGGSPIGAKPVEARAEDDSLLGTGPERCSGPVPNNESAVAAGSEPSAAPLVEITASKDASDEASEARRSERSDSQPTGRQYASLVAYTDAGGEAAPMAPPHPQQSLALPTERSAPPSLAQDPDSDTQSDEPEDSDAAELARKLDAIPVEPGVYLLRDSHGKVLYVGKAKSLRSRVRSYFREGGDGRFQVRFLMRRVCDFETLVARNEKEALILENNLIKQYKPRYNIRLKDDKSYLSAKITNHPWPRITVTRRIVRDGGRYLGPFGSADGLRETIDVIRKVFPLRTCSDGVFKNRARPCIEYQIKRCMGPCVLPVDRDEYGRHLHAAELLLEGKDLELLKELRERMRAHADRLEFEDAARVRDSVRAIEKTVEKQTVLHHWGGDQDVFGLYREGGFIEAIVLMVRNGKLTSTQGWSFQDLELPDTEIFADLLTQFYAGARFLPSEVILPVELEDAGVRAELLSERRGKRVDFLVPQRGDKLRLLEMATENARQSFASRRDHENTREKMLDELRAKLHLRNSPKRIECYDISNLQGSMVVGSQATFDEGLPQKALYRRYRIRTVVGQDDFASLYEVLSRRLRRAREENSYPDLWVIDGGKGQLNVATEVLKEFELFDQIDVISLAKQHVLNDPRNRAVVKSEERVFLPNRKDPIVLPKNSTALFLLVRIRDEAHRFAITYNRELRRRARLRSVLDDIEGIGPTRRKALLRHFGSLRKIREASLEQLALVKGVNLDLAAEIRRHLDSMAALLDRAEQAEREEEGAEYLDAGQGQLELIARKPRMVDFPPEDRADGDSEAASPTPDAPSGES